MQKTIGYLVSSAYSRK